MNCPICGAPGKVVSVGAFGWRALCSECYEPDAEAPTWRHLDGMGDSPEQALEEWSQNAREYATTEDIPSMRCPSRPRMTVAQQVTEQAHAEFERQRRDGWHLIEVTFQTEEGELDAYYLDTDVERVCS